MISYAALSPHPPLIIPAVGGQRIKEVSATVQAMKEVARVIANNAPDTLIFLTPHGNVFSDCITCLGEPELYVDLSDFGAGNSGTRVGNDMELVNEIARRSARQGIDFVILNSALAARYQLKSKLDHGILVPLYYIQEAMEKDTQMVAISTGFLPITDLYALGKVIQEAADHLGRNAVVVASGDMSHRLTKEGPYEYHPDGERFDQSIRQLLEQAEVENLLNIPAELRDNAGECGYRSMVILMGTLDGRSFIPQIFSYEGPFGVGYLVAGLTPGKNTDSILEKILAQNKADMKKRRDSESTLVRWARMSLESHVRGEKPPILPVEMEMFKDQQAGVFVSIKKDGALRGCIGTTHPVYPALAQEIASNAISAGTRDPRFTAVQEAELEKLVYSVDILGESEECSREDLNPAEYGVIVESSGKTGLLLPHLEGIDTVEQQLSIALQKAGINRQEKYLIFRFKVERYD